MEQGNALAVGTRLGGYEVLAVLGRGGFGITYRAYDPSLNKVVAIKEYLPGEFAMRTTDSRVGPTSEADRKDYEWGLARFVDEARTLARFDHPHVNRVYRFFEANGTAYMVLEYVEGEVLSARLRQVGPLTEEEVARLLADVLSGLEAVHEAGYVHRDLKPGNLMVRPDGRVVILDFGAARQAVGQRSKSITSILTPGYAPIEQYDTKAEDVGPWSDIYALGMVAYRCISGLGDGDLPDAVTRSRHLRKGTADLTPAATLGKGRYDGRLLEGIDRAIRVNEDERPQSIAAWRTVLPPLEERVAVPSSPPPIAAKPARPSSSMSRWVTMAGVIALIGAVGGGAYWLGQRTSSEPAGPLETADVEQGPASSPVPQTDQPPPEARAPAVETPVLYPFVVETEPVGAEVEVLGIEEPYRTGLELPVGRYQVEVRAAGYESQRVWVEHTENEEPYRVELATVRHPFTIVAEPAESRIRIMNIPERYQAGMELPVGDYEVEVSAEGYTTATETVVHGVEPTERRIALARAGRQPGETFRDCPSCPELVVVPAGSYQMGSPSYGEGRDDDEGPVHQVTIERPFAVGVYEVTRGEYERFVGATRYAGGNRCYVWEGGSWEERSGRNWRRPGFRQTERDPVVCVSWEDAQAYAAWLSEETGQGYRLLSEAEWEYVARAGTTSPFHFGETISPSQANYDGNYTYGGGRRGSYREQTVAVGSFPSNAFGLYDVHGNVWEWVQDCHHENYNGAPSAGQAWERGECSSRVLRGGSWYNKPRNLRSANRSRNTSVNRIIVVGFRIARSLP